MESHRLAKIVNDQYGEWLLEPTPSMRRKQFKQVTARRWALSEIVQVIRESSDPVRDLNVFTELMWQYSQVDPKTREMFLIAHHLSESVLEFVIILTA